MKAQATCHGKEIIEILARLEIRKSKKKFLEKCQNYFTTINCLLPP